MDPWLVQQNTSHAVISDGANFIFTQKFLSLKSQPCYINSLSCTKTFDPDPKFVFLVIIILDNLRIYENHPDNLSSHFVLTSLMPKTNYFKTFIFNLPEGMCTRAGGRKRETPPRGWPYHNIFKNALLKL